MKAIILKKQTPTVGCFFMAEDYIKFLKKLQLYLYSELKFIKPEDSKWKNKHYGELRSINCPRGYFDNRIR